MTKISIITPSIGRETLLRLCQSIDNQTCKLEVEFEHIIVTDGPEYRDSVLMWTEPFKHRIKYLVLPNNYGIWGGPARAVGAMLATGDFTCFLDDDNWIEPNHFNLFVEMNRSWGIEWCAFKRFIHVVDGSILPKDPEYSSHIDGNCFIAKTSLVKKYAGCYAGKGFIQDREFIARLKQENPLVCYPQDITVHYYTKWTREQGESFIRLRCG